MKNIKIKFGAAVALLICISLLFSSCSGLDSLFGRGGDENEKIKEFNIVSGDIYLNVGDTYQLYLDNVDIPIDEIEWLAIGTAVTVSDMGIVTAVAVGEANVYATYGEIDDKIKVTVIDEDVPIESDPYVNVDKDDFYASYTPATSYLDSYYRSLHSLMSGSIEVPDAEPIISEYQPRKDGMLLRNADMLFSEDGNTYYVYDAYGNKVMEIYKCGAYTALEEVAAYVYAFGTYPPNHSPSKKTSPLNSEWGIYLRVNHTKFSGSTSKYPYEPELPNITGCGGRLEYWEMDIGTTGTGGGGYYPELYNNGTKITRGAARIVYGKSDLNGNGIFEFGEHYVFYTYNHYNDFQEYLNYYGGWGEMFGNITGGGELSSKYDYNPTPYVEVYLGRFADADVGVPYLVVWYTDYFEKLRVA